VLRSSGRRLDFRESDEKRYSLRRDALTLLLMTLVFSLITLPTFRPGSGSVPARHDISHFDLNNSLLCNIFMHTGFCRFATTGSFTAALSARSVPSGKCAAPLSSQPAAVSGLQQRFVLFARTPHAADGSLSCRCRPGRRCRLYWQRPALLYGTDRCADNGSAAAQRRAGGAGRKLADRAAWGLSGLFFGFVFCYDLTQLIYPAPAVLLLLGYCLYAALRSSCLKHVIRCQAAAGGCFLFICGIYLFSLYQHQQLPGFIALYAGLPSMGSYASYPIELLEWTKLKLENPSLLYLD